MVICKRTTRSRSAWFSAWSCRSLLLCGAGLRTKRCWWVLSGRGGLPLPPSPGGRPMAAAARAEEDGVVAALSSMSASSSSKRPESLRRNALARRGGGIRRPSSRWRRGVLERELALLLGAKGGSMPLLGVPVRGVPPLPELSCVEGGTGASLPLRAAYCNDKLPLTGRVGLLMAVAWGMWG